MSQKKKYITKITAQIVWIGNPSSQRKHQPQFLFQQGLQTENLSLILILTIQ